MSTMLKPLLTMSYTGQLLVERYEELKRLLETSPSPAPHGRRSKCLQRCLTFAAFDLLLGFLMLSGMSMLLQNIESFQKMSSASKDPSLVTSDIVLGLAEDYVVPELRRLLTWVMGAPAGLKLNSVLSASLGRVPKSLNPIPI